MKKLNEDYKTIKDHNKSYVPLPTTSQVLCHSCANSPQGQTVQRSEKLHLGLYRSQPARQMLMFITVQCMALSKGLKWKPRLSKRNMTAQICKDRTEKKDFWNNGLLSPKDRVKMFGYKTQNPICQKPNTAHQRKQLIPTSKHGEGRWALQPLSWPWNPQLILTPEA